MLTHSADRRRALTLLAILAGSGCANDDRFVEPEPEASLECEQPLLVLPDTMSGAIIASDWVQPGTNRSFDVYGLELSAPREVQIDARSADFDTHLILDGASGERIADDHSGGIQSNARIVETLDPGCYLIQVASTTPGDFGAYSISVIVRNELLDAELGDRRVLDGFIDVAAVRDRGFGRRYRNYTGVGFAAEAPAPFGMLAAIEWGYGIRGLNADGSRGTHVIRVSAYKMF